MMKLTKIVLLAAALAACGGKAKKPATPAAGGDASGSAKAGAPMGGASYGGATAPAANGPTSSLGGDPCAGGTC
jgi:hypothetical protein